MDRSRDFKNWLFKVSAAVAVLLLVLFFSSPLSRLVRDIYANLVAPRNISSAYNSLSRDALIQRLTSDEAKLSEVGYQAALYALLSDENAKLRKAANAPASGQGILGRVISRPPKTLYDTILVDVGTSAGVQKNNLVEYEGVALGQVVSVGANSALVQLFSSAGNEEDVLLGSPQAIAVAHGMGGGAFELSVPQGVSVNKGDPVRIESSASLLLGIVAGVSAKPTDASQTVSARSPVSFPELDFVEILPLQHL